MVTSQQIKLATEKTRSQRPCQRDVNGIRLPLDLLWFSRKPPFCLCFPPARSEES